MTGQVPDARPYVELMDIAVNASDEEPFGIVLIEAMGAGVPVVAVAKGGPLDIIEPGVTGMLAESGEPAELAEAIEAVISDPARRAAMGEAGLRTLRGSASPPSDDRAVDGPADRDRRWLKRREICPEVTIVANDIGAVGGMERQLTELITGLLGAGRRVTVISWTCDLPEHPNMRWIRVPGPSRPFAIAYPVFLVLASLLVRFRGRGAGAQHRRDRPQPDRGLHRPLLPPRLRRDARFLPRLARGPRLSAECARDPGDEPRRRALVLPPRSGRAAGRRLGGRRPGAARALSADAGSDRGHPQRGRHRRVPASG